MAWLTRHVQAILIGVFAILALAWAVTIGVSIGFGGTVLAFFFTSVAVSILIIKAVVLPIMGVVDEKLRTATSASDKWLCASGTVGIFVFLTWMICADGTISALLGGPKFGRLPCSAFTSFGWTHVIIGVGATALPLLMAGYCVLAGSTTRSSNTRPFGRS